MIRIKILSVILLTILLMLGVLYFISSTLLLKSYVEIENTQMERNIARVVRGIDNFNGSLGVKLRDWAWWDDSYQYVQDGNTEFAESNLIDTALLNLEINLLAYVNQEGKIIFSQAIDLQTEEVMPSEDLVEHIISETALLSLAEEDGRMGGIISVQEGILIIEALPILKTDETGPSAGTLIFGSYLNEVKMLELEELTQLSIELVPLDSPSLPTDIKNAQKMITKERPYFIMSKNEHTLSGYFEIRDVSNGSVAMVKIESERLIYKQGKKTVAAFAFISGICIFLLGLILLILLERLLLSRFGQLSNDVDSISINNLRNAEVAEGKQDEIGKLARKINHLLAELAHYQKKEATAVAEQKNANLVEKMKNEEIKRSLEEKAGMNKLMVERELKMIQLKEEIAQLKEKLEAKNG